jgi:hypothetical protein
MRVPVGEPRLELIKGSVAPEPVSYPASLAEEVWQLVQEWYAGRLEPVPDEDRTACMKMLEEERAEREAPAVAAAAPAAAPKPAYGTPEFWKAHWAKKRAASEATAAAADAQTTNPSAPVPQKRTVVPKAKPPPKTPAAKATAQAGAPQESKSSA